MKDRSFPWDKYKWILEGETERLRIISWGLLVWDTIHDSLSLSHGLVYQLIIKDGNIGFCFVSVY